MELLLYDGSEISKTLTYKNVSKTYSLDRIKELTGRYACGVTALIPFAYKYDFFTKDSNFNTFYSRMWNLSKTSYIDSKKEDGSTSDVGLRDGFVNYCKQSEYSKTTGKYCCCRIL